MCVNGKKNGTTVNKEIESNSFSCPLQSQGYDMNGWYFYCDATAFGLNLTEEQLVSIGCNEKQRQICKCLMERTSGIGIVPKSNYAD